jgi:FixJ family two-component response regulator
VKQRGVIHIVDPDEALARALTAILGFYKIGVRHYANGDAYLNAQASLEDSPDCLLVDADQPRPDGIALLRELREQGRQFPIVVISGAKSDSFRHRAKQLGALEVLDKPLFTGILLRRLSELFPNESFGLKVPSAGVKLRNGAQVTIRAMRPEDADIEQAFVRGLSKRSRYLRFFSGIPELTPSMLEELTHPEFPGSYALIATVREGNREKQIGEARYAPSEDSDVAEFAVVVDDAWQGLGLATHLLQAIISAAAIAGIRRIEGFVLKENTAILRLAEKHGFRITANKSDASARRIEKDLEYLV